MFFEFKDWKELVAAIDPSKASYYLEDREVVQVCESEKDEDRRKTTSCHYKIVRNGRGTNLTISEEMYITVGNKGENIMLRGDGKVFGFDDWSNFLAAIKPSKTCSLKDDVDKKSRVLFNRKELLIL